MCVIARLAKGAVAVRKLYQTGKATATATATVKCGIAIPLRSSSSASIRCRNRPSDRSHCSRPKSAVADFVEQRLPDNRSGTAIPLRLCWWLVSRWKRDGGAGGIRTLDTAFQPYNGLANRRLQPLGHSTPGYSDIICQAF